MELNLTHKQDPLAFFMPPVRAWFEQAFGRPTPPQAQGWPAIQRGEHTLILAPTGSGKTLAAFMWGIDRLFRELTGPETAGPEDNREKLALRLVYISPLKALNNDIQRTLRLPLRGIRRPARELCFARSAPSSSTRSTPWPGPSAACICR